MPPSPRRHGHTVTLSAAILGACALWAGCGGDAQPRIPPHRPRPASFFPEQFPDIPLPRGYVFQTDEDQLAIALAGGTVRRFDVAFERRVNVPDQSKSQLLEQVAEDLTGQKWILVSHTPTSQRWHKGAEDLLVDTGRIDSRTTIRYRLRPTPGPATTPAP